MEDRNSTQEIRFARRPSVHELETARQFSREATDPRPATGHAAFHRRLAWYERVLRGVLEPGCLEEHRAAMLGRVQRSVL